MSATSDVDLVITGDDPYEPPGNATRPARPASPPQVPGPPTMHQVPVSPVLPPSPPSPPSCDPPLKIDRPSAGAVKMSNALRPKGLTDNGKGLLRSSDSKGETFISPITSPTSTAQLAAAAAVSAAAMGRDACRPGEHKVPLEVFKRMTFQEFEAAIRVDPELLGPGSMTHESWGDSSVIAQGGPTCTMLVLWSMLLLAAGGLGVGIGFLMYDWQWGFIYGAVFLGGSAAIFMTCLIVYMVLYSGGLKANGMGCCVDCLGYEFNIGANLVCRSILTCCYNPCCNMVNCVMGNEAGETLTEIEKIQDEMKIDGEGPPPGGVCFLGDSEYTFWHNLREDMAAFHPNCFNAGFGGSRCLDLISYVGPVCLDWDPSIVIVHAAGNDFDFEPDMKTEEMPRRLVQLFELLAAHESVEKIGYMLSSRRPVYSDVKWAFMIQVHAMTIDLIKDHEVLKDIVKVIDLRDMVHPLSDFVLSDRVHLNSDGHYRKSQVLVPKLLAVWPNVSIDANRDGDEESPTTGGAQMLATSLSRTVTGQQKKHKDRWFMFPRLLV